MAVGSIRRAGRGRLESFPDAAAIPAGQEGSVQGHAGVTSLISTVAELPFWQRQAPAIAN
jgi:hypothetical protein